MYWILLLQQFLASTTHIVGKSALNTIQAPLLMLLRAIVASITYILFLRVRGVKLIRVKREHLFLFIILGLLNIPLNQYLFFNSLKYTSPPNVALAYAVSPAFVLIIAFLFLKEKISFFKTLGIITAIIGTSLILFEKGIDFSSDNFYGTSLALLASLSWALYTIIGKKFVIEYGAVYTTAVAMVFGLILYLPLFFLSGSLSEITNLSIFDWSQIFYLGVITSGVAYVLWYIALKKFEAGKVSVFNNLQPILTTILSVIIFNHELTLAFLSGGILTILGVLLTQKG